MQQRPHTLLVLFLATLIAACNGRSEVDPADLVLLSATVHTLAQPEPVEAVAVRDGHIVAVGSNADMQALIGESTRVLELGGQTVVPGFTDAHMHLWSVGMREIALNLQGSTSKQEFLQRVADRVADATPGEWIDGRGWIETFWDPPEFPTRQDLDTVAPNNPVFLERADGHGALVNSLALDIASITATTEDPFGGEILRATSGEPNGMLLDNAHDLVLVHMPEDRGVDMSRALVIGAKHSASLGWTQIQIAYTEYGLRGAELIEALVASGEIPLRVYAAVLGPSEDADSLLQTGTKIGLHNGRYTLRSIKVSLDGALGSRGAALLEPYADRDSSGFLKWREDELLELYETALRNGVQIETHAIGDRANRFALDLYERAFANVPVDERAVSKPRWRIEHAQHLHQDDLPRFKTLDVIPSMQASHAIGDLHFAPARLGLESGRLATAYAWRSLIDSGVIIAGGTDAPVEVGDPLIEFYAAITRKDLSGYSADGWHPELAVSRQEALKMLTLWPAVAAFEEDLRGSIEVGKYADFTVLDADIMQVPAGEIPGTNIVYTIVGGEIVYGE